MGRPDLKKRKEVSGAGRNKHEEKRFICLFDRLRNPQRGGKKESGLCENDRRTKKIGSSYL